MNQSQTGGVILYETPNGDIRVDVQLQDETVWLSQEQMTALFDRERSVITKHIRNVFAEGELDEKSNVQNLHIAGSDKPVKFYNLDVIISVGYRVKSQRGSQFRIWATRTLKDHLLRGYSLNQQRLLGRGLGELQGALEVLQRTFSSQNLTDERGLASLEVVQRYLRTFGVLLAYDEARLPDAPSQPVVPTVTLELEAARAAILGLREALVARQEATGLFGLERGDTLPGILASVEQTFGGESLYPSVQVRAANLLYFVVKDHPFADGNKRIGALLFLEYLRLNGLLLVGAALRLDEMTVAAVTLLVAESQPEQKDLMVRLVMSLLEES